MRDISLVGLFRRRCALVGAFRGMCAPAGMWPPDLCTGGDVLWEICTCGDVRREICTRGNVPAGHVHPWGRPARFWRIRWSLSEFDPRPGIGRGPSLTEARVAPDHPSSTPTSESHSEPASRSTHIPSFCGRWRPRWASGEPNSRLSGRTPQQIVLHRPGKQKP